MIRRGVLLGLLTLLPACSAAGLLSPSGSAPRYYSLRSGDADAKAAGPIVSWQLLIDAPRAPLDLDSTRIAVAPEPSRVDFYAGVAWTDRLPAVVQSQILEAFERSDRIAAVQRVGGGLRADFLLATEIRDFAVDMTAHPVAAHIRIDAKLVRMRDRSIVASRIFDARAPVLEDGIGPVVAAFGSAVTEIDSELVAWTLASGTDHP